VNNGGWLAGDTTAIMNQATWITSQRDE
jgi:hypothetical protein